jgi:predicted metal-dependent phosphoesterase TrpH
MKMYPYVDFHTHTTYSDGNLTAKELVSLARQCEIGLLAITDHNSTENLDELRRENPDIQFVQGAEISCLYADTHGIEHEIHVPALGFDPNHPKMQAVFRNNMPDRRPYVEAILHKLRLCGVELGSYDDFCARVPKENKHFGRMELAKEMVRRNYVNSPKEAFDIYFGGFGERRAFVPNTLRYVSMEQAVDAILSAGGVPVLAHLFYYRFDCMENHRLIRTFRSLTGDRGGMETDYGIYDAKTRQHLREVAAENKLMCSCASDFHGVDPTDTLNRRFSRDLCRPLLEALQG